MYKIHLNAIDVEQNNSLLSYDDKKSILSKLTTIDNDYLDASKLLANFKDTQLNKYTTYAYSDGSYPFFGSIGFYNKSYESRIVLNGFQRSGTPVTGILKGTSPHFTDHTELKSIGDPGTYYLERTNSELIVRNESKVVIWSKSKSDFTENVVPLRLLVFCQGPGGRGQNGYSTMTGGGGGSGGFIAAIIDLHARPRWQLNVGKGAREDSNNHLYNATESSVKAQIDASTLDTSNYMIASPGNNGSGNSGGSGGTYQYTGDALWIVRVLNGVSGGSKGNNGTSTSSQYITFDVRTNEQWTHLQFGNHSGGSVAGNNRGGGGGASYFAAGGQGGGGDSNSGSPGSKGSGGGGSDSQFIGTAAAGDGGHGFITLWY